MPINPTIEELRSDLAELLAEAESDWERRKDDPELSKAERFSAGEVWALQKALKMMQPKPSSVAEVIEGAIADPTRAEVIEIQLHTYCGWRTTTVKELRAEIVDDLSEEGYSIHYDGKPVAPSLNPVVDTGESLKVQLAKQINVLAKLLAGDGYTYDQYDTTLNRINTDARRWSRSVYDAEGNTIPDPAIQLASRMTLLSTDHLYPGVLGEVLSVVRDQYILSTDIGQAIDRLNELVSLVHESEA